MKKKRGYMKKEYYLFQMRTDILNIWSLIIMFAFIFILYLFYGSNIVTVLSEGYIFTLIFMIPYFILHEIFHSIAYVIHGADFKNITYGAHLEKGVLCCLCKQNILKKNIMISLIYPFVFLGIITLIIGLIFNIYPLIILSIMNISGCTGDFIMFYDLIRIPNFEFSEYDNPIAFALESKEDLSKRKLLGLNYLGKTTKIVRTIDKKIDISKPTIIYILLFIIFGLISYLL